MDSARKSQLSSILFQLSEKLDISETRFIEAEERYKAVGKWLGDKPEFSSFNPKIYPQGSFLLGTIVKPITEEDEYDIDLVFQLELSRKQDPQEYKEAIGNRLKENGKYAQMLSPEGRRCWTLNYAESTKFHVDVLPAISEIGLAIGITDKTFPGQWLSSNPLGYAKWFKNRMLISFMEMRKSFAFEAKVDIADVPEHRVKTPLQRAIQILKRHRDIMFKNDLDNKPISMIITTLAAMAYNNETDLVEALLNIINRITRMPQYIENRNGILWVANPINSRENFADKWQEYPSRASKFIGWLHQVKKDLETVLEQSGIMLVAKSMKATFGERAVTEAVERLGKSYTTQREAGALKMTSGTGMLGAVGTTTVNKHTFYGI